MGNVIENIGKGVGDFVGNIGSGIGNAFKGLTGGSTTTEGEMGEIRKKIIEQQKAQAGKQGVPMKKGGSVSSASSRADGIAIKGKTRGKMC